MFSEETVTVRHPFPAAYHPRPVTIPLTPRGDHPCAGGCEVGPWLT